ncbi:Lipopolysaccharide assembly protein A [bioreactor metagenome]|uniref:Lipopolysaccharide assembly protein A n=1 Tax=bioreactor metagenome TaxID=1076179 RepID=A0A644TH77_9ZZZZ|nr:LapA family protein [Negativicutes bacterium]
MLYVTLLFTLVFAFLIAAFALQNSMIVNVNFMVWNLQTSLVLVILGAATLGFLMALSLQLYGQMKLRYQLYKAGAHIKKLEEQLAQAKQPEATQDAAISTPPPSNPPV